MSPAPRKILTVVGARPQFIKAAVVSRALGSVAGLREVLLHTGQHHDPQMSDVFFDEMEIPRPSHRLDIHGLSHGAATGRMIEGIEGALRQEMPDAVMVYGDTNSTVAGALAAVKMHLPVVHVEAGLRSFNPRMPEEWNRILTDRMSQLLCCPSETAIKNLEKEGFASFAGVRVALTGDVMFDAVLHYRERALRQSKILEAHGLARGGYFLATVHRAENTDDPARLKAIVEVFNRLGAKLPIVWPVHPRTAKVMSSLGLNCSARMITPVGYFDMLRLIDGSRLVLTDSGGLQKEARFLERPCVTLRDETEWVELVHEGANEICGTDPGRAERAVEHFLSSEFRLKPGSPYGQGDAGARIVTEIKRLLAIA